MQCSDQMDPETIRQPDPGAAQAPGAVADEARRLGWSAGPDGLTEAVDDAWVGYVGQGCREAARDWIRAVHSDERAAALEAWQRAIGEGATYRGEHRLRRADGVYRRFLVRIWPRRDDQGAVRQWLADAIEAEDQVPLARRLHASEELVRRLLACSRDCIHLLDLEGRTLSGNRAGVPRRDARIERLAIRSHWPSAWAPEQQSAAIAAVAAAAGGGMGTFRGSCPDAAGRPTWWEVMVGPLLRPDGTPYRLLAVARDITDDEVAGRALRESEERLRQAVAAADAGTWRVDIASGLATRDAALNRLLGLPAQASTQPVEDFLSRVHPEDRARVHEAFTRACTQEVTYEVECRVVRADGSVRWVRDRGRVLRSDHDQGRRLTGTLVDITERKRAEEEAEVLNQVGRGLTEEIDLAKVVQAVTDAATALCGATLGMFLHHAPAAAGIPRCALSGRGREAFVGLPDFHLDRLVAPVLAGDPPLRLDDVRRDPRFARIPGLASGHLLLTSYLAVPVRSRSGVVLGGLLVGHCDAQRFDPRHERQLVALAAQAAVAIDHARLYASERRARIAESDRGRELARSNAELEQFAYVASHDLQEPLRMVANFLRLLSLRHGEQLDEQARSYIAYAVEGAMRMHALIKDLLDYSRLGHGEGLHLPVPLAEPLREALDHLQPQVAESGATIEVGELPVVSCNRLQMLRLFQNLLANALKFRAQAPPRIVVSARPSGEGWELAVADNGIGIEPAQRQRIFEVFQRLHDRVQYPGTGIGLALCRKIVLAHGGRIWVEATPGGGATFRFTLQ